MNAGTGIGRSMMIMTCFFRQSPSGAQDHSSELLLVLNLEPWPLQEPLHPHVKASVCYISFGGRVLQHAGAELECL